MLASVSVGLSSMLLVTHHSDDKRIHGTEGVGIVGEVGGNGSDDEVALAHWRGYFGGLIRMSCDKREKRLFIYLLDIKMC